jgi:hypothetical protein
MVYYKLSQVVVSKCVPALRAVVGAVNVEDCRVFSPSEEGDEDGENNNADSEDDQAQEKG